MATTDTTEFEEALRKRRKSQAPYPMGYPGVSVDGRNVPGAGGSTTGNYPGATTPSRPPTTGTPGYPFQDPGQRATPPGIPQSPREIGNPFQKFTDQDGDPMTPDPPPPPYDPTTPQDPDMPQSPPSEPPPPTAQAKTYENFVDAWHDSDYGPTPAELRRLAEDWNRDHPNDRVEITGTNGDKIRYRGRVIDVIIAAGAGGTGKSRNDITDGGGGEGGQGAAPRDPSATAFWDAIMKRGLASPNADPNDPMIRSQVNAYRAEQTRAARDFMSQQAESAGAYYNPTGEARLSSERVGSATGAFQASLLAKRWEQEKQEIMQYAQMYGQYLTQQEQMALTERLNALNNALQWALLQQNAEFHDDEEDWRRDPANPANRK